MLIGSLAAFFCPTAAHAAEPADYNGSWVLDKDASQPMAAILERRGLSWFHRRAAAAMGVTLRTQATLERVTESFESTLLSRDAVMEMDGVEREEESPLGELLRVRLSWGPEGELQRVTEMTCDGTPCTERSTRRVSDDGQTLTSVLELEVPGEPVLRARRIFRRKGGGANEQVSRQRVRWLVALLFSRLVHR